MNCDLTLMFVEMSPAGVLHTLGGRLDLLSLSLAATCSNKTFGTAAVQQGFDRASFSFPSADVKPNKCDGLHVPKAWLLLPLGLVSDELCYGEALAFATVVDAII